MWLGSLRNGYGVFTIRQVRVKAHRYSYSLVNGEIPDGLVVCHRCDTPVCVRPEHLFAGSAGDNARDMAAKGRQSFQTRPELVRRGVKSNKARLTESDVRIIRALYADGNTTLHEIGVRFGVHLATIHGIVRGRTWRHVL